MKLIWINLLQNIVELNSISRPRSIECKDKKKDNYESVYALYKGGELILKAFKRKIFPRKAIKGEELNKLSPKQMLQRFPLAFAQVKSDNNS